MKRCSRYHISGDEIGMATPYGQIAAFHPESDSIKAYLEHVKLYFAANKVNEEVQVPILLSCIGAPTYSLLSDLLAPSAPSSKSLQEISDVRSKHFEPKRVIIAQRFHFHKCDLLEGESMADYDAKLRKLATHCDFGNHLEEALRDRFVCGLRHEAIQRRLLSEVDLTYTKALDIASAMEAANRDAKAFQSVEPMLKKLHSRAKAKDAQPCFGCNRPGHSATTYKFMEAECHACGKKGHIAPACRSKSKGSAQPQKQVKPSRKHHKAHQICSKEVPTGEDSSGNEHFLHKLGKKSSPITVSLVANGKPLKMEVDTGADISIISEETRKVLFPNQKIYKSDLVLKTYTGEPITIIGNLHVRVQYRDQFAKLVLVVEEGNGPSLLAEIGSSISS